MSKLNHLLSQGASFIDQARKSYWDFIERTLQERNEKVHIFRKGNSPSIIFEDDDGLQQLTALSISKMQVFFDDETEFDIGDLDTDQLRILAEYLEMDLNKNTK